jgi:hypothetical protein
MNTPTVSRSIAIMALTLAAPALLVVAAQAAPVAPRGPAAGLEQSLAQTVDYRGYCSRWRAECSNRWGWRTWRYRRCMTYHGCA